MFKWLCILYHKKKVSVNADSAHIFQNPLFQCYRSKTYTDNDITLHLKFCWTFWRQWNKGNDKQFNFNNAIRNSKVLIPREEVSI